MTITAPHHTHVDHEARAAQAVADYALTLVRVQGEEIADLLAQLRQDQAEVCRLRGQARHV